MPLLETVKEGVEKLTGWARPSWQNAQAAIRPRKPRVLGFVDDGIIPNNELPLVVFVRNLCRHRATDQGAGVVRDVEAPAPRRRR